MTYTDFTFRRPVVELTEAQLLGRYPGLPEGWAPADDVALWEGLFLGLKLGQIGAQIGKTIGQMQARFLEFHHAATERSGPLPLKAQTVFLQEARRRAGVPQ